MPMRTQQGWAACHRGSILKNIFNNACLLMAPVQAYRTRLSCRVLFQIQNQKPDVVPAHAGHSPVGRESCYVISGTSTIMSMPTREHFCDPGICISNWSEHHRLQSGLHILVATILIQNDVLILFHSLNS